MSNKVSTIFNLLLENNTFKDQMNGLFQKGLYGHKNRIDYFSFFS